MFGNQTKELAAFQPFIVLKRKKRLKKCKKSEHCRDKMMILEKIKEDLRQGLKNADANRVGVLRLTLAALQNEEIAKRGRGQSAILTDEEALAVLKKEAKKRKESIEIYERVGRKDLLEKEKKELEVIRGYLPVEVGQDAIEAAVKKIIESGVKDFGTVMKEAMKELKGSADGSAVAEIVKKLLQ